MLRQRNSNKNRRRRRAKPLGISGPSSALVQYRGPSQLPVTVNPPTQVVELQDIFNVTLANPNTFFADVTGSADPQALPIAEFTTWSGLYREYRVLAVRVEFWPTLENTAAYNNGGGSSAFPWATVVDRDTNASPTTYSSLVGNSSLRWFPLNHRWMREVKMASTEEAEFSNVTSAPAGTLFVKSFFTANPTTTLTLGTIFARYILEFRTRV